MLKQIKVLEQLNILKTSQLSLKNRRVVDQYVYTLKTHNLQQQRDKLIKVYETTDLPTKLQCLNLMLNNYLRHPKFIRFHDVREIISDFNILKDNDKQVLESLKTCLLYCIENTTKNKETTKPIIEEIMKLLKDIGFGDVHTSESPLNNGVRELIENEDPFNSRSSGESSETMDMNQLCDFIKQPYKNLGMPLFEYYDQLDTKSKDQFMRDYLKYNRHKQNKIELESLNISSNLHISNLMSQFGSRNADMLLGWSEFAGTMENLNEDDEIDKIILKHEYWLSLVGYKQVTNLILINSLSHLSQTKSGSCTTTGILRMLVEKFTAVLKIKVGTEVPVPDNELLILFAALFKKFSMFCKVDVPADFVGDTESIKKNQIDMRFLFTHRIVNLPTKTVGKVFLNPYILNKLDFLEGIYSDSVYLPMIYPPKKWKSPDDGGFLNNLRPVILHNEKQYLEFLKTINRDGLLDYIFKNLDYMSSIPWCIDIQMKEFLKELVHLEDGFLNFPGKTTKQLPRTRQNIPTKSIREKYERSIQLIDAFNDNIIYFPHGVDFRSRCYTLVSFLSYQDEDLIRSIFQFWDSRALGASGYDWIKYQAAGLYGLDKLNFEDRVKFINDNIQNIKQSAVSPRTNLWWTKSDKPWQFLRHCFEITKIENFDGEIKNFKSRLPIHLDGSCNGLQHYAAIGRDIKGAKAVNLLPTNKKEDVYTDVLEYLLTQLSTSEEDVIISKILSRKIVKRPIMTSVYGVTVFGAVKQMEESLKEANLEQLLTREEMNLYSKKLTIILFRLSRLIKLSLDELFKNAKFIQLWLLSTCQRVVTSIDKPKDGKEIDFKEMQFTKPMMWSTITGFPVIQMYFTDSKTSISTPLQHLAVRKQTVIKEIHTRKQYNSVAPNFIHSIDATHLLFTCNSCQESNIPFVAVHDSFWTSPDSVDGLNTILRQQFVNLYASDIVNKLRDETQNLIRDSYHLVWFSKSKHKNLHNEVMKIRDGGKINIVLNNEIKDTTKIGLYEDLIERFQPELITQISRARYANYSTGEHVDIKSFKNYVPILVKAKLLPTPPTGDYNIEDVKQSEYFFS